jgi:hypothetical protein
MRSKLILATFNSGSTYLQRSLTFWIHELLNDNITNPHELLNGIGWYNGHLVKQWCGVNDQSVDCLIEILQSNHRPIVIRLAYDHCLLRQDISGLKKLYDFLGDHFDIYYTRRDNLFDYGMCYAIRRQTNRSPEKQINNVYSAEERHNLYNDTYKFIVSTEDVVTQAQKYLRYLDWVHENFVSAKQINYEEIEENMDLLLATMTNCTDSIQNKFGISIRDYTRIQYERSKKIAGSIFPNRFEAQQYQMADTISDRLVDLCNQRIMLDPIPIKSTTILDKISTIDNFRDCVAAFNDWAATHNGVVKIDDAWLRDQKNRDIVLYQGT